MRWNRVLGALAVAAISGSAHAQQQQIDISAFFNDSLTGPQYCCSAAAYPTSGVLSNLGVTFSMASIATTGAPLDVWRADFATNRSFNLAINQTGVTQVYTLMDTRFGFDYQDPFWNGLGYTNQGALQFNFLNSGSVTQYLDGCLNIRDHNPGGYSAGCWAFNQPAPSGSNAQQFASFDNGNGPVVFDMQTWDLSAYASDELLSIDFIDSGPGAYSAFLRGVTIQTASTSTPEPSSLALLATGLVGVAGIVRRKKRASR